jgi:DNA invertase Pin-like site-specific DNA recombinase
MKVALYARVSKSDKEQNPDNQLLRMREYAQRQEWEFEEFKEFASGADSTRPIFSELLRRCRHRDFDVILTVRLDRMMRSVQNTLTVIEELEQRGIRLMCLDQPIDTATAAGRFQIQMLAAVAEFERETLIERINDGMERAKKLGTRSGRPIGRPKVSDDKLSPEGLRSRLRRSNPPIVSLNTNGVK